MSVKIILFWLALAVAAIGPSACISGKEPTPVYLGDV